MQRRTSLLYKYIADSMVLILCINVKIVTVDSARINCSVLKQIKHKIQRSPH